MLKALRLLLALLLASSAASAAPPRQAADIVLRNGVVATMDATRSWAQAVAIRGGRIVFVGTDRDAATWIGRRTQVTDLGGRLVLPAFHDSHVHPVTSGMELLTCNLNEAETAEDVFATIRRYVDGHPKETWITGGGWQLPIFPGTGPTKAQLDAIVLDRPALLFAADGHSSWANSRALALAGVTKATPDPPNGRIERDANGEPTGTLREDASALVTRFVPKPSHADHVAGLRIALRKANSFGITSLYEANGNEAGLAAYKELDDRGELTARVSVALEMDVAKGIAEIPRLVELRRRFAGKRLSANAVKIFIDGVIESQTAALLEPYVNRPGDRGKPNIEPDALEKLVAALDREGFQVHIHAIGDRAIRISLDAFEHARSVNGVRDSRHHIGHLQLIDPADIPRFRRLDVIANFQPLWAYADPYITDLTEPVLGPARSRWLYPFRSVAATGAVVVGGSDWSVSSLNPLDAIQVAVTRRGLEDATGKPWIPEEIVDIPTIVAAYTINGAYVTQRERETGSIEVGKSADLVVVDRNIFDCPPAEIHKAVVTKCYFEGRLLDRNLSDVSAGARHFRPLFPVS